MTALAHPAAALADRYRIERELSAGDMATVYLAEDLKHDRQVAITVVRPELAAGSRLYYRDRGDIWSAPAGRRWRRGDSSSICPTMHGRSTSYRMGLARLSYGVEGRRTACGDVPEALIILRVT